MPILESNYDYTEFFIIVGVVFGLVIICAIALLIHTSYLKKRDKKTFKEMDNTENKDM